MKMTIMIRSSFLLEFNCSGYIQLLTVRVELSNIFHYVLDSCLQDWVAVLEDEDEDEGELDESDETLADWAKLETMRSSHPMFFAKKLAEVRIHCKLLVL